MGDAPLYPEASPSVCATGVHTSSEAAREDSTAAGVPASAHRAVLWLLLP